MEILDYAKKSTDIWNSLPQEMKNSLNMYFHLRPTNSGITIVSTIPLFPMRGITGIKSKSDLLKKLNDICDNINKIYSVDEEDVTGILKEIGFKKRGDDLKEDKKEGDIEEDIQALKHNEIGAILTLEGCDAIGTSLIKYKTLLRLGVSSVGLTWNYANAVSDGILEERGAGLSTFGKNVVKENNLVDAWTDVSHLSVKGFWDVLELAKYPIASHSNAYTICNHSRNLSDDQIKALISKNGMIGITFVPHFLNENGSAHITDVLKHIDYICALGGEFNLGFGSDFDGITETVIGLSSYKNYEDLINLLLKYYKEEQVKRFLFSNFVEHLPN